MTQQQKLRIKERNKVKLCNWKLRENHLEYFRKCFLLFNSIIQTLFGIVVLSAALSGIDLQSCAVDTKKKWKEKRKTMFKLSL